jgi:ABC-type transport system involved in multi-copper enzyme maturation permease subunit
MIILFLIRKEFALQIISAKFAVMTLLVLSLTLVSVFVMHGNYRLRIDNYDLLKPDGKTTVALKRPGLASILVKGSDERMGQSMTVNQLGAIAVGRSQRSANRLFMLFQEVDFHYIALVVLSLAAVIFSFDMISREKRDGTLKLMSANGIGRARILLSKWLAALSVVMLQAVIALLICLLYLSFIASEALDADFYLRVFILALLILLYLAVFTAVGLLISSITHRPSVSIVFALLVWAVLVFIVPNAAVQAGCLLSGGESLELLDNKEDEAWMREIFLYINDNNRYKDWLDYYRQVKGPVGDVYRYYINKAENRIGWVKTLSYSTPAGIFSFCSWATAGTGPTDEIEFKREVIRYQNDAVEDAYQLFAIIRGRKDAPQAFEAKPFVYGNRPLWYAVTEDILLGGAVLLMMAIGLFTSAGFFFSRYDVR